MKKKAQLNSVKWNGKNKLYLQRLGIIDPRTGKVKKGRNLSGFINGCVTMVLESDTHPVFGKLITSNQLRKAWIKYNISMKHQSIKKIEQDIINLGNMAATENYAKEKQQVQKVLADIIG